MGIQNLLQEILYFINDTVVPLIIGLAFLFFIWNAAKYFIIQGAQEAAREKARSLALWGIIAFVLMLSTWSIVNIFVWDLGLSYQPALNSDYIEEKIGGGGTYSSQNESISCSKLAFGFVWCSRTTESTSYNGTFNTAPSNPQINTEGTGSASFGGNSTTETQTNNQTQNSASNNNCPTKSEVLSIQSKLNSIAAEYERIRQEHDIFIQSTTNQEAINQKSLEAAAEYRRLTSKAQALNKQLSCN